ncbi:MAG TPA: histidine kinase [Thermoleophilaceae bacterium]
MADSRLATGLGLAVLSGVALTLAWAIAALLTVGQGSDFETTYAAALPAARVADLAAGVGLIVAGGLAAIQPRTHRLGVLAVLAGLAWFGADWEGAEDADALLRSLGAVVAPLTLAFVFHLALAVPDGRLRSSASRVAVIGAYALVALLTIARALFRDPLLDLYCWRNCTDNSFLIHADAGLASTLSDLLLWSAVAIALALVAFVWRRLLGATGPGRRALLPILGPALLVGAAEATYAITLLRTPLEDPDRSGFAAIFLARSLSYTLLALGLVWSLLRVARTRARLARLASDLGEAPRPGMLRDRLVSALGDPGVDVLYPRDGSAQLIDADGRPADPPGAGRAVSRIARGDRPVALVLHDPALVNEPELARALGSAARLSVENEALRAEAMAQLHALQASRARIVETADSARRRLERDLHDGAQQRLLALSYDVRLARGGAADDGDLELVSLLDTAATETEAALEELRELAHGIYPAILAEAGLGPALETLADEAPLPVEVGDLPRERAPLAVERTVYVVVDESIGEAAERGAGWLRVGVSREADSLVVALDDDGSPRQARLVHLQDRVGALGGALDAGANTLRAEIPCG